MTCIRSKASYSTSPKWPCPGSQNASRAICAGERGNSVFDQRRPRSRTPTERPAWASRQAVTLPPNPEPTTTTSYDARIAASPARCRRRQLATPSRSLLQVVQRAGGLPQTRTVFDQRRVRGTSQASTRVASRWCGTYSGDNLSHLQVLGKRYDPPTSSGSTTTKADS